MRRKAAAIVQRKDGWYGLTLSVREKEIGEINLYTDRSLTELKRIVDGNNYGIALENGSTFLFNLTFPFSGKSKIGLIIGNELEQRLPVSVEDMQVSFVETSKGKVLAGTLPKSVSDDLRQDGHLRITTIQSLAALYALRWFRLVPEEDFVFVHMNENAIVVMGFRSNELYYLRQFFHSPETDSLGDAFAEIAKDRRFAPRSYLMVGDNGEADRERQKLEKRFRIEIRTPSLQQTLRNEDLPEWSWPGLGAALMSTKTSGQLNLTPARKTYSLLSSRAGVYVCAGLACVGLLTCGLSYLDYGMKQRVYAYLANEPGRVYRATFPKSPPPRDPLVMFKEKIKALEKEPGAVSATAGPLAILNELSRRIPPDIDVKVNEFSSDEKEFTLSGTTVSYAAVEKIKTGIEQVRGVSQVEAQNLELTPNKQVKFKLRGRL